MTKAAATLVKSNEQAYSGSSSFLVMRHIGYSGCSSPQRSPEPQNLGNSEIRSSLPATRKSGSRPGGIYVVLRSGNYLRSADPEIAGKSRSSLSRRLLEAVAQIPQGQGSYSPQVKRAQG